MLAKMLCGHQQVFDLVEDQTQRLFTFYMGQCHSVLDASERENYPRLAASYPTLICTVEHRLGLRMVHHCLSRH